MLRKENCLSEELCVVFLSNTSQLMMTGLRDTDLTLRGKAGSGSGLTLPWAGAAFLRVNTREATGQFMTQDCTIIRAPGGEQVI